MLLTTSTFFAAWRGSIINGSTLRVFLELDAPVKATLTFRGFLKHHHQNQITYSCIQLSNFAFRRF